MRSARSSAAKRRVVRALFIPCLAWILLCPGPAAFAELTDPLQNFGGMSAFANPPDTVGDVGPNHFVQMVNATQYQVWNKNGASLFGPFEFGNLWPAGQICNSSTGDPIVVYDHLADRWLLSQFAFPFFMCIAISSTPSPATGPGGWLLYTFSTGSFPDYPKFGVWPDGYYMTSFEGSNLGIYVFDRNEMLSGSVTGNNCGVGTPSCQKTTIPALGNFGAGIRATRILPADLDGPAPPAGTPNPFVRTVDSVQDVGNPTDRIEVYDAAVNWAGPSFSFTLVDTLTPDPFNIMLCNRNGAGVRDCVPQPDVVDTVDALSNRPMMQLKYSNFGAAPAMVFNQTIDARSLVGAAREVAGVRWYELRKPGANWTINDQGTFADQPANATEPQLLHRWMGSAAIDQRGNIAIGYSIGNSDSTDGQEVYPGIRYTGRLASDPPGTMPQGEKVIRDGVEPQGDADFFVEPQRWGDYSALSLDPSDDCTFWFTNHIAGLGGRGPRPTQIASFRFESCLNQPPDCSAAFADPEELWPPQHQFEDIAVGGVTDADGDPITITIDSIHQDEVVWTLGAGAGQTAPDATGIGTDTASVRVERNGNPNTPGDGRVYHIEFTADDGQGGSCSASVPVCVPHDRGAGRDCVDGGPIFDSTLAPACGIGFELALLLPPLMALRARRRARSG